MDFGGSLAKQSLSSVLPKFLGKLVGSLVEIEIVFHGGDVVSEVRRVTPLLSSAISKPLAILFPSEHKVVAIARLVGQDEIKAAVQNPRALDANIHSIQIVQYGRDFFSVNNEEVMLSDVAAPDTLLPIFCWHAQSMYKWLSSGSFHFVFPAKADAFLSHVVSLEQEPYIASEPLLYLQEAVVDFRQNLPRDAMGRSKLDGAIVEFMKFAAEENLSAKKEVSNVPHG